MKILFFSKTDALGDQVLATGLVGAYLRRRPSHRVVWLVREGVESVADLIDGSRVFMPDPEADPGQEAQRLLTQASAPAEGWARVLLVPVPFNPYTTAAAGEAARLSWWIRFAREIRPETAAAGTTTVNWLDQLLVWATGASSRFGHGASPRSHAFAGDLPEFPPGAPAPAPFNHEVAFDGARDELGRLELLAGAILGESVSLSPELSPRPADLPPAVAGGSGDLLVIAPGTGEARRGYPEALAAAAVAHLVRDPATGPIRCVLFQGPRDAEGVSGLEAALAKLGISASVVGPDGGLALAAALARRARVVLCNESFHVHLAAALGAPAVAVWGLGHWGRFLPRRGPITVVHAEMPCYGCDWQCCFERWRCVTDIPAERVGDALADRWRSGASGPLTFAPATDAGLAAKTIATLGLVSATMLLPAATGTSPVAQEFTWARACVEALRAQAAPADRLKAEQAQYIQVLERERGRLETEGIQARRQLAGQSAESQRIIDGLVAQLGALDARAQGTTEALQAQFAREAAAHQKTIDELLAQLAGQGAGHRKTADDLLAQLTAQTADHQKTIDDLLAELAAQGARHRRTADDLLAQLDRISAVAREQTAYIRALEAERDRLAQGAGRAPTGAST